MADVDTSADTDLRFSRSDRENWDKLLRDLRDLQAQLNQLQKVVVEQAATIADHESRLIGGGL